MLWLHSADFGKKKKKRKKERNNERLRLYDPSEKTWGSDWREQDISGKPRRRGGDNNIFVLKAGDV